MGVQSISEQYERGTYIYFDFHLHNSTATASDQSRSVGSTASGNQPVGWYVQQGHCTVLYPYSHQPLLTASGMSILLVCMRYTLWKSSWSLRLKWLSACAAVVYCMCMPDAGVTG